MYDTVNFRLLQSDAEGVDFLEETAAYLDDVGEHLYDGNVVITGSIGGLKVSLSRCQMHVKDRSLCKWHLGNNFQAMGRGDTQKAIERLSDTLHVPMKKATVTRVDVAQNFICRHLTEVYLNHMGVMPYSTRLQEPDGLYYKQANGRVSFYDKNREQKAKREPIPELYAGRNVLRFEQRYTRRLAHQFKVHEVTAEMLYNETFYIDVVNRWQAAYDAIRKINDVSLNFEAMKNKQQLHKMGVCALVEQAGGELAFLEQISEAQKCGNLTKKQAYDLRQAVKDACKIKGGFMVENDAILELDKKVAEATKFYR